MPKSQPYDMWEPFFNSAKLIEPSRLKEFLRDSSNTVARERIFTYRLMSDLKLAAAMCGYHLQSYEPNVDRDGHDMVIEDDMRMMCLQFKTVFDSNTTNWKVRKRFISADAWYADAFEMRPQDHIPRVDLVKSEGIQGGAVLIYPKVANGELAGVSYWYSDIFIIAAMQKGLVPWYTVAPAVSNRINRELKGCQVTGSVTLNKRFFVRAKDAERLLALTGLKSRYSSSWRLNLLRFLPSAQIKGLATGEKEECQSHHGDQVRENLKQLIDNPS